MEKYPLKKQKSNSSPKPPTTEKALKNLVRYWTFYLRLRDWNLDVTFGDSKDLHGEVRVGMCGVDQEHKSARIRILHPKHFAAHGWDYPNLYDIESTLVHELLHIHLDGLDEPESRERELEQAINSTTGALIALKYNLWE